MDLFCFTWRTADTQVLAIDQRFPSSREAQPSRQRAEYNKVVSFRSQFAE